MEKLKEAGAKGQNTARLIRRIMLYVLGIFILALGVSFSVKSNLGVSPVSVLPYVLSLIFELDMGLTTAGLFTLYVLLQAALLGRRFQIKNLLQILVGVLFGSFVSITNRILFFDMPDLYPLRLLFIAISIVLVASGVTLILAADIMCMPPEGVMMAIQHHRPHWKFSRIKVGFDCTAVSIAILLSFLFLGGLQGAREGTILSAVLVGVVMGQLRKLASGRIARFIDGPQPQEDNAPDVQPEL